MHAHPVEEETDRGPAEANSGRARFCIATGEAKPTGEMIRYVVAPDGSIVPDIAHKLPGRGAWLSASREALRIAIERKLFARAFRGKGVAGAELPALVERLLQRAALDAISMANKAGQVVIGFERVKAALNKGTVAILVHASDAGAGGIQKLDDIWRPQTEKNRDNSALYRGTIGLGARATKCGTCSPVRPSGEPGFSSALIAIPALARRRARRQRHRTSAAIRSGRRKKVTE